MNYLKSIISIVALSAILIACDDDFLERYPLDKVSSADFFKQPSDMMTYLNRFYNDELFPVYFGLILDYDFPYTGGADDYNSDNQINASRFDDRLTGIRTISYSGPINWKDSYEYVENINYFFDNYQKCTGAYSTYEQYVGEAYFFRALIYFRLLQTFGDVPYYTTTLNTTSPELYASRTPRNLVADNIINDLDSAARHLSAAKNSGASRIHKWIALLFQSRVALYEGTWQKYHANDVFKAATSQPEKYLNKAVEAAGKVMDSGLFDVYSTGKPTSDYADLFTLRNYDGNSEVLSWKKFSVALSLTNNKNNALEYPSNKSITKELADAYLCTDGDPISVSTLFKGHNTIMDEMKNRDPRFYQTIFTPDAPWMIDASGTKYWNDVYVNINTASRYNSPSGYVIRKGYNPTMSYHSPNYEETPSIHFRYAEVLLNYAEAKAELGTITQADIDRTIKKLRDRVGMPNIVLGSITVDTKWDFPTLSPIINEIRRERKVELATEGFRWNDIARWAAADELIVGKRPKGAKAAQYSANPFPVDAEGFLDPFATTYPNGYGFAVNRDYLNPIPEDQTILNKNLTQNPGWAK